MDKKLTKEERLTKRGWDFIAEAEKDGMAKHPFTACLDKLQKYEDAHEDGRLCFLPCGIGNAVYTNISKSGFYFRRNKRPYKGKIVFIGVNDDEQMGGGYMNVVFGRHEYMMAFDFSEIGKTVFLNFEDAEEDLQQREERGE